MGRLKMVVDTTGEVVASIPIAEWRRYIATFVEERSFLNVQALPSLGEEARFLKKTLSRMERGKEVVALLLEGKRLRGMAHVWQRPHPHQGYGMFGIAIEKGYRGKGQGRMLAEGVIGKAFEVLPIHHILLEVVKDNRRAVELYKGLGFRKVAHLPRYYNHYGEDRDALLMILPKEAAPGRARGKE